MPEIPVTNFTLDVTTRGGLPCRVVLVPTGERSPGRTEMRAPITRPTAEFYDRRYPHTPMGQFIAAYHADTLLEGDDSGATFLLWADVPDWRIDGDTMVLIRAWLRHHA